MKVVLFCGGLGQRLRDHSERVPKPMIPIGYRPILWHIMKYYAHFGHRDFTLCLGYKADVVKQYFLNYNEALSNDFVLDGNGGGEPARVELLGSDIHDWRITFADTGLHANIGQRLVAVKRYVEGEEVFLANYGDVLTYAPCPSWSTTSCAATRWPRSWPSSRPTPSTSSPRATTAWWSGSTTCASPTSGSTAAT